MPIYIQKKIKTGAYAESGRVLEHAHSVNIQYGQK